MGESRAIAAPKQQVPTVAIDEAGDGWTPERVDLVRRTIAKDCTEDEIALFLLQCRRTGLDPFSRQIHAVKRWDTKAGREVMTIQTGIDGYRLIADRTGQTDGQEGPLWCGEDGKWVDVWLDARKPPLAAKVTVFRRGQSRGYTGVAHWSEYAQRNKQGQLIGFWVRMPASQLAKCFSPDTEILTEHGFRRFDSVDCRVLQVTGEGLQAVHAVPFRQQYAGEMVCANGDMLNFAVTPNHDMVTTFGKVEAGAMYQTLRTKPVWHVPLRVGTGPADCEVSDEDLELCGYVLADGWHNGHGLFNVSVSRPYKVEALGRLSPSAVRTVQTNGQEADAGVRVIRSNFDKLLHAFPVDRCLWLFDTEKRIRHEALLGLSMRQAKILLDAWQHFDGYTNRKTGVRRLYTSRLDHVGAIEVLAAVAGYTINAPRRRMSDISDRPNYSLTISSAPPAPVTLPVGHQPGVVIEPNASGEVWCVTVPSGVVVVRRKGFSMLCGNCAEALALRKAYPQELSGLYTDAEMDQAEPRPADAPPMTEAQISTLDELTVGYDPAAFKARLKSRYGIDDPHGLNFNQAADLIGVLRKAKAAAEATAQAVAQSA